MIEIIQKVVRDWKPLFVTGLLFKLVAFIVLTPCVGILFRFFVKLSGRTVLADVDIASFLLPDFTLLN